MKTVIIGGGAAGMMAAYSAKISNNKNTSSTSDEVILIEKNEKLGKKIFISGKGRGNLTNNCEKNLFFDNIIRNRKFFYSAFETFSNKDTMSFFIKNGLKLKIERGNRVFPEYDKAYLITDTFKKVLENIGVKIILNAKVLDINISNNKVESIIYNDVKNNKNYLIDVDKVIIATGGKSYSSTGSTGDGYKFATKMNINVNSVCPALVPIKCYEIEELSILEGLKLKNIAVKIYDCNNKIVFKDFGELYFEKDYLDGPIIRKASSIINQNLQYILSIDFKPGLDESMLDKRLIREIENKNNVIIYDLLRTLLPNELCYVVLKRLDLNINSKISIINKENRMKLCNLLKKFKFNIFGNMGFDYAIITRGGIDIKEINPSTMEAKKVKGVYFAGEVIDIDAFTGGFNMQIAFSTGFLAGVSNVV